MSSSRAGPRRSRSDLAAFFTLSLEDLRWVRSFRSPRAAADRLGLAVQLCALPFLGLIPAELTRTPVEVVERLAQRIGVAPGELARYVELVSDRSRREHAHAVIARAGWRTCGAAEWLAFGDWLLMRALEHDTQAVLFRQALDHLQAEKVARPGPDRLMRAVATARAAATREIHRRLQPLLIPDLVPVSTPWSSPILTLVSRRSFGSGMARRARPRSPSRPSS